MTIGSSIIRGGLAALALAVAVGCRVSLPDEGLYTCASDAECGGGGYVCIQDVGSVPFCCRPSEEVCDGLDNDCDRLVDELPPSPCYEGAAGTEGVGPCRGGLRACSDGASGACEGQVVPGPEACNGLDDDCDGTVDEDFDLTSSNEHCGACNNPCGALLCVNSRCVVSTAETQCGDGEDNDNDLATDCADSDCEGQACGAGCQCAGGTKRETSCGDGEDNDGDGPLDCADSDCEGASCGAGCTCAGGVAKETVCGDGVDNDGDGQGDCGDSDCSGLACKDAPATFVCEAGACACGGNPSPPPEGLCTDGADQDCDGRIDCADADCNNQACGIGCTCKGGVKAESRCDDRSDNDQDGSADCEDVVDCPVGTPCNAQGGTCRPSRKCQ